MKKILLFGIILLLSFSLFACLACSKESVGQEVRVSTPSKEELMMRQLEGPDLLAIMESSLSVPAGQQKPNKLAIKNAYDRAQSFRIEICEQCSFARTEVEIPPGAVEVIDFTVSGVPGEKTVVVRDDLNNFYAKDSFTVEG